MQNILILGGTRDGLDIVACCNSLISSLHRQDKIAVIYSIAGVARTPHIDCTVRVGGFGGSQGLLDYIVTQQVSLIIDATHPYASIIKSNALQASLESNVPLYRFVRPLWQQTVADDWTHVASMAKVLTCLHDYKRPFFSIGRSAFEFLGVKQQPAFLQQHWTVRYIQSTQYPAADVVDDVSLINDIGPFSAENERQLLQNLKIDVLISKNSGGDAVAAKIIAARQLRLPVIMLNRPELAEIPLQFDQLGALEAALTSYIKNYP